MSNINSDAIAKLREGLADKEKRRGPVRDLFYNLTRSYADDTGEKALAGLIHMFSEFIVWTTDVTDPAEVTVEMTDKGFHDYLKKHTVGLDQNFSEKAIKQALNHFFTYIESKGYHNKIVIEATAE